MHHSDSLFCAYVDTHLASTPAMSTKLTLYEHLFPACNFYTVNKCAVVSTVVTLSKKSSLTACTEEHLGEQSLNLTPWWNIASSSKGRYRLPCNPVKTHTRLCKARPGKTPSLCIHPSQQHWLFACLRRQWGLGLYSTASFLWFGGLSFRAPELSLHRLSVLFVMVPQLYATNNKVCL